MPLPYSDIPSVSGIYRIYCVPSGKYYVGSAVNVRLRRNHHYHLLRAGTHHSIALQRAWNKYGEESFRFEIIEEVEPSQLFERENYWFQKQQEETGNHGYNMAPIAQSTLGIQFTPEALQANRDAARKRRGRVTENMRKAYDMRKERAPTEAERASRERRKGAPLTPAQQAGYARMKARGLTQAQIDGNARRHERPLTEKEQERYEKRRGVKVSKETRQKQTESLKKMWAKRTEEERQAIIAKVAQSQRGIKSQSRSVGAKHRLERMTPEEREQFRAQGIAGLAKAREARRLQREQQTTSSAFTPPTQGTLFSHDDLPDSE
jgi:group I intron endonuclease